jgi:hypothetical protein
MAKPETGSGTKDKLALKERLDLVSKTELVLSAQIEQPLAFEVQTSCALRLSCSQQRGPPQSGQAGLVGGHQAEVSWQHGTKAAAARSGSRINKALLLANRSYCRNHWKRTRQYASLMDPQPPLPLPSHAMYCCLHELHPLFSPALFHKELSVNHEDNFMEDANDKLSSLSYSCLLLQWIDLHRPQPDCHSSSP